MATSRSDIDATFKRNVQYTCTSSASKQWGDELCVTGLLAVDSHCTRPIWAKSVTQVLRACGRPYHCRPGLLQYDSLEGSSQGTFAHDAITNVGSGVPAASFAQQLPHCAYERLNWHPSKWHKYVAMRGATRHLFSTLVTTTTQCVLE